MAPSWSCVQLSDPHVVARGQLCNGVVDTGTYLREAVDFVAGLELTPNLVLVTGDLTNGGHPDEYDYLAELLAPLKVPLRLIPGNHDDPTALLNRFGDQAHRDGRVDGIIEGPVRTITLDSSVPGEPGGDLYDHQLAWLEAVLQAEPNTPTLVALHHPPFATGIAYMDAMGLASTATDGLAAVVQRHPQVARVVCGHLHRAINVSFAGTVASTAPSTAMAVSLDLVGDGGAWSDEPPMATIHAWIQGSGLVSHLAPIRSHRTHPF